MKLVLSFARFVAAIWLSIAFAFGTPIFFGQNQAPMSSGGASPPVHVQSTGAAAGSASSTIAATYAGALTNGTLLVCAVSWLADSGQTISGVSDGTQTWTHAGTRTETVNSGSDWSIAVFYRPNNTLTSAATVTATISASSTYRTISISEYSGAATSSALDQINGRHQTDVTTGTDAVTSSSVTTTQNNELIYGAAFAASYSNPLAAGTGYSSRDSSNTAFHTQRVEDKSATTPSTVTATWTASSASEDTAAIIVTFKSQ